MANKTIEENLPKTIEENKLLLVEGKDEVSFFECWLQKLKIKGIKIIDCGGRDNFENKFKALKNSPGFTEIESLAVIQDADDDDKAAFKRVCSILKKHQLEVPDKPGKFKPGEFKIGSLKTAVFILTDGKKSDGKKSGMLESVCLSIVKSKEIKKCINFFMDCIEGPSAKNGPYKKPKNKDKARLRAFLAAMEEDCPSLGVAAKKDYFDFQSDELKPLLNFLEELADKK